MSAWRLEVASRRVAGRVDWGLRWGWYIKPVLALESQYVARKERGKEERERTRPHENRSRFPLPSFRRFLQRQLRDRLLRFSFALDVAGGDEGTEDVFGGDVDEGGGCLCCG